MAMNSSQQEVDGRDTDDVGKQNGDVNQNIESQHNSSDTKRETQTVQIGKRSATLFLSSTSIKARPKDLKDVPKSTSSTPAPISRQTSKREKSRIIPEEMKQFRPQREFTFTGYDIMADGKYMFFHFYFVNKLYVPCFHDHDIY
jgi:hypothetical protein